MISRRRTFLALACSALACTFPASVLAQVSSPGGAPTPALVVQQFGRGRTAALLVGDLWPITLDEAHIVCSGFQAQLAKPGNVENLSFW